MLKMKKLIIFISSLLLVGAKGLLLNVNHTHGPSIEERVDSLEKQIIDEKRQRYMLQIEYDQEKETIAQLRHQLDNMNETDQELLQVYNSFPKHFQDISTQIRGALLSITALDTKHNIDNQKLVDALKAVQTRVANLTLNQSEIVNIQRHFQEKEKVLSKMIDAIKHNQSTDRDELTRLKSSLTSLANSQRTLESTVNANVNKQNSLQSQITRKQGLIDSHSEIFRFVGIRGTNDIQACPTTQQQVLEPFLNRLSAPDNKPSKHDTMAMEFLRLYSMHDYPSKQGPSLLRLAEAGFYYEGNGNELTCFSCGVCNRNWSYGDSPKEIHQRLSPGCKFLTEEGGDGNVPVPRNQPTEGPSELATSHSGIRTFDRPNTEDGASAMEPVHNTAKSPSASCKQPMSESLPQFKHPKYASDSARLASFQSFPLRRTQSPALLASAGFFYAGYGDCCKCFSCGIGLGKWEPEDNPWVEHARWSQECPFILQMKGQAFIDLVQEAVRKADMTNSHLNDENDSSDVSGMFSR
uniref:Baculoviral IAP repeat-containing protein 3 n=1 Tax=Magallana gigas TaxID=29159 RepID=K1R9N9_MAGGI